MDLNLDPVTDSCQHSRITWRHLASIPNLVAPCLAAVVVLCSFSFKDVHCCFGRCRHSRLAHQESVCRKLSPAMTTAGATTAAAYLTMLAGGSSIRTGTLLVSCPNWGVDATRRGSLAGPGVLSCSTAPVGAVAGYSMHQADNLSLHPCSATVACWSLLGSPHMHLSGPACVLVCVQLRGRANPCLCTMWAVVQCTDRVPVNFVYHSVTLMHSVSQQQCAFVGVGCSTPVSSTEQVVTLSSS
jgi:hypothetical protein